MKEDMQAGMLKKSMKAYVTCLLIFMVFSVGLSAMISFGPLPETSMGISISLLFIFVCFLMGMMGSSIMKKRGLFFGMAYASIWVLTVALILFSLFGIGEPISLLQPEYGIGILFGGIGGIFGVNQKK